MKSRVEADSNLSEQSAESRGSCSEDFGSRSCGHVLAEASESCRSSEDLATDEQTNGQESQIRSFSHQLIHSKVAEKLVKRRFAYEILDSGKSSEHNIILFPRDDDQNRGEELNSLLDIEYLLINTIRLYTAEGRRPVSTPAVSRKSG